MKQLYFVCLFLLLAAGSAAAQVRTLQLARQSLPALPRDFYIAQVLDCRIAKDAVGEVQTGMLNSKAAAVLPNPLEQELFTFISTHHPKQDGQKPVILRVNKLWVSELTTFNTETGTAELLVDFIYKQDSAYQKLYSAASIVSRKGIDVTKKHETNVAEALQKCLKEFSENDFDALLAQSEALTEEEAKSSYSNTSIARTYPVMEADAVAAGIYLTLDEFRNNAPGLTSGYEIRRKSAFNNAMVGGGEIIPMLHTPDGKTKALKAAWGFTDGSVTYVNYGGAFYPMAREGDDFVFMGPPPNNNSGAIIAGMVVGGAIGGAVAGSIAAAYEKPVIYTLDLVTGAVHYKGKPVGVNTADAKLVLYRVAKDEQYTPLRLKLNGVERSINPNELIELDLSTTDAGTSICLAGQETNCINFMPTPNTTYYIACNLNKKAADGKAELKQVKENVGEYEAKGIRFAQKKAEKAKQ